jgi:hypothetical protein
MGKYRDAIRARMGLRPIEDRGTPLTWWERRSIRDLVHNRGEEEASKLLRLSPAHMRALAIDGRADKDGSIRARAALSGLEQRGELDPEEKPEGSG